jgi:hypothetical protein
MGARAAIVCSWALLAAGCGSSSSDTPAPDADADVEPETDAAPAGCAPGEMLAEDGHCEPAGIPPSSCGAGFAPDGRRGCNAIVPPDTCPSGTMAVPGETACRDVAPCGAGTWGTIPVDASTQFVDGSFAGTSDGSSKAPWKTIQQAIDAAAPNAVVAIAAGSYAEEVRVGTTTGIGGKPVRLWGVCPAKVEIVGGDAALAAVTLEKGASKSEVHDVAVRGAGLGIIVSGATDVVLDRVWIHDAADYGFDAENTAGATSASLTRSLVERSSYTGVFVSGSNVIVEASVVRDTQPWAADDKHGYGINVVAGKGQRGNATIRGSIVEGSREVGVLVQGSDAILEATLVRDTRPQASDDTLGRGVEIEDDAGGRANVTLRASVVEGSHELGVFVAGSDATIETTVVRDTQPRVTDQTLGRGIGALDGGGATATVTIRASVIERSHDIGIGAAGSDVIVEATIVRDTAPRPDGLRGRGIELQVDLASGVASTLTLRSTLIASNREFGLVIDSVLGVVVDRVLVRDTQPRASDGLFGDGISIVTDRGPASVGITASRIEASARAGLSSFGGAVTLGSSTLECDAIALDGETFGGSSASFVDQGGNVCGCSGTPAVCQILSSGLAPPESVGPSP